MEILQTPFQLTNVRVCLKEQGSFSEGDGLRNAEDAVKCCREYLSDSDREVVMVINLTKAMVPINASVISVGSLDYAVLSSRDIIKCALLSNSAGIIVMHNHPSGSCFPSKADIEMTEKLKSACEMFELDVVDHVIFGKECFSMKQHELI